MSRLVIALHLALILAAGLALHGSAVRNPYVYEDLAEIGQNPIWGDTASLAEFLVPGDTVSYLDYYNPLAVASLRLDARLFWDRYANSPSPAALHAVNVALFLAVSLMAYGVLALATGRAWLSLLAILIFVAHPATVEPTRYVIRRGEILAAFFTLAAILCSWLKASRTRWRFARPLLTGLLALAAMLSAAAGLAAPALVILADWLRQRNGRGAPENSCDRRIVWLSAMAAWLAIEMIWLALFGLSVGAKQPHPYFAGLSALDHLWAGFHALFAYAAKSLVPYPSTVIYDSISDPLGGLKLAGPLWAGAALAGLAAAVALGRRWPLAGFSLLWFALALAPNLPFRPLFDVLSESKLLLPNIGFSAAAAALILKIADRNKSLLEGARNTAAAIIAVSVLTLFAAISFSRGSDWRDGMKFWNEERRLHPTNETVLASIAYYEQQDGRLIDAENTLREARSHFQRRPETFLELAGVLLAQNKPEEARAVLDEALAGPALDQSGLLVDIGEMFFWNLRDSAKSIQAYELAAQADPDSWRAHHSLGNMMLRRRDLPRAAAEMTQALESVPKESGMEAVIRTSRGVARRELGELDAALEDFERAEIIQPAEPRVYTEMARAHLMKWNAARQSEGGLGGAEAIEHLDRAIETLNRGMRNTTTPSREIYLSLMTIYREAGDIGKALEIARNALAQERLARDAIIQVQEAFLLVLLDRLNEAGARFVRLSEAVRVHKGRRDPKLESYIYSGLGYCMFQKAQFPEALELAEAALERHKTNPMGLLLYRLLREKGYQLNVDLSDVDPNILTTPITIQSLDFGAGEGPVILPGDEEEALELN